MLTYLIIRNFAIIDHLEIPIHDRFTVITGETGAGKSILINALNLLLGGRASTDIIRHGSDRAVVEGTFELNAERRALVTEVLEAQGIEVPGELIVRRLVSRNGRNKAFINGSVVALATLREVTRGLVDISGQHEHYSLLYPEEHINVLDGFGGHRDQAQEVAGEIERLSKLRSEARRLQQSERERLARIDFLRYQLDEIDRALLEPKDEEEFQREIQLLRHSETLRDQCGALQMMIQDGPHAIVDAIGEASSTLSRLTRMDERLEPFVDTLEDARLQLADIGQELRVYLSDLEVNPERLEELEELVFANHQLKRRFGDSYEEIVEQADAMRQELRTLERARGRIQEATEEAEALKLVVLEQARALSQVRRAAGERLKRSVEAELSHLGMIHCKFAVYHHHVDAEGELTEDLDATTVDSLNGRGLDKIEFMIRPNPGAGWGPLAKIASGGELSRIMLAIKTGLMLTDPVSTYVFDEVDTGIGGATADVVGEKIKRIALNKQVLCITHLPQIASYGDHHLKVAKVQTSEATTSTLRHLSHTQRVGELARMLGGRNQTDTTMAHAEEMILRAHRVVHGPDAVLADTSGAAADRLPTATNGALMN